MPKITTPVTAAKMIMILMVQFFSMFAIAVSNSCLRLLVPGKGPLIGGSPINAALLKARRSLRAAIISTQDYFGEPAQQARKWQNPHFLEGLCLLGNSIRK
jgi:hypothetical protein